MTVQQLQPKSWGRGAEQDDRGYIRAADQKSTPANARQRLGYLLALIHGAEEAGGKRLLSTLFTAYYQEANQAPIAALQRALAAIDSATFPQPQTLLLAVLHHDRLYLSQTGTGYAYLWRDGELHRLADGQKDKQTDIYRPIITQPRDRLLLSNARLHTLEPYDHDLTQLLSGPGPDLWQAIMQHKRTTNISLLLAQVSTAPASETAESGLAAWQWATWAVLALIALLQIVALLALRW